jgi:hypothetical protein
MRLIRVIFISFRLNFIKNKFGNLLKIAKDGKFQESIAAVNSAEDVE